mmetsp:Transcript_32094/g.52084  ORF Transcript_32094/g.52084 Transcript_32094/m.52084 type:complete len:182 (-) Transcript_32094:148-693(-)
MEVYSPSRASSAACVPRSTTRPRCRTTIWSARRMVDSRWAITSVVRSRRSPASASCTESSVLVSSAEVASSRRTTGGSFRRQRAIATRCFSPPLSLSPRSPTLVSQPSGSDLMNSRICAASHAASTSAMLASMRPYFTLCSIVSLNITVSCGTTPMAARTDRCVTWLMSWPFSRTWPASGS